MNEIKERKIGLLCKLIDSINNLKKDNSNINLGLSLPDSKCNFESENLKIFCINLYILLKIFHKEVIEIKDNFGNFGIEEYYTFIEGLDLPDAIYKLYAKMPDMLNYNRHISYVTDIPGFMKMAL